MSSTDRAPFDPAQYDPETVAVRAGIERSQFGEHGEALFLTSSFVFDTAAEAAARFSGNAPGNVYARFTNPTVTMFRTAWPRSKARKPASPPVPACRPSCRR